MDVLCPETSLSPTGRIVVLSVLIIAVHLLSAVLPQHGGMQPGGHKPTHKSHVAHVRHLEHLHWLHLQHQRHERQHRQMPPSPVLLPPGHGVTIPSGHLTCTGLETLWELGGGSPSVAFMAAEIAEAESGGNQYATGPYGERGYWQINPDHGYLSTYDPLGNARAAVAISDDGRDWSPWTTYRTGAYAGLCLLVMVA